MTVSTTTATCTLPRLRIVALNDVYELTNLPRLQTFLTSAKANAVVLAGDFLSPSILSAVDGGKAMVSILRAVGLTHCCIGNHEADLKLSLLQKRLQKLGKSVTVVNSNIGRGVLPRHNTTTTAAAAAPSKKKQASCGDWLKNPTDWMPEYSILQTPCQRVKIALTGFLSDEHGMFRDDTFRGVEIGSVTQTYSKLHQELVIEQRIADWILPLTHQTIHRDRELAQHMMSLQAVISHNNTTNDGLILGGHEHTPIDVTETDCNGKSSVRILKSGCDAEAVNVVDLTFFEGSSSAGGAQEPFEVDIKAELVELSTFAPSVIVTAMVQKHMSVLETLENENVVTTDLLLPPGVPLSSVGTRYRQTTVGSIFCTAIRDELEVDVAVINGATIKGETEYPGTTMSYAALKQELPFPTKMVVVPMKRWELHEAIHYSRTHNPDITNEEMENDAVTRVERKGFLQVDVEFDRIGFHAGDQDEELMVALPRNLLNGFCNIVPLMRVGERLKAAGKFPADDDYIRAIDLIVRHFCKERWMDIAEDTSFQDLDLDNKGFLTRSDVKRMLKQTIGREPADFLVDNMIASIDEDDNGVIDPGEFSHLLANMEREHGLIRFD